MLIPQFPICDVRIRTIFLIFFDARFCLHLVIIEFKQVSAETRWVIVFVYNEGKSQRFIAEETVTSHKGVRRVLKWWRGSGESTCQPQSEKKWKSSKRFDKTLVRLTLANRKLPPKE